jgi:hypothetical protein
MNIRIVIFVVGLALFGSSRSLMRYFSGYTLPSGLSHPNPTEGLPSDDHPPHEPPDWPDDPFPFIDAISTDPLTFILSLIIVLQICYLDYLAGQHPVVEDKKKAAPASADENPAGTPTEPGSPKEDSKPSDTPPSGPSPLRLLDPEPLLYVFRRISFSVFDLPLIFFLMVFFTTIFAQEVSAQEVSAPALITSSGPDLHLFLRHCALANLTSCTDWALTDTVEGVLNGVVASEPYYLLNTLPVSSYEVGKPVVVTFDSAVIQSGGHLYVYDALNGPWPGLPNYRPGTVSRYAINLVDHSLGRPRSFHEFAELCGFALSAFCGYQALAVYLNS